MVHITAHAIERHQERVANVSDDDARAALSSPAVKCAIAIGAMFVRLGTGQRIAVRDGAVITVLPADNYRKHVRRVGKGRYG